MLWVDKYRPSSLSKLDYHVDMAENLEEMAKDGELPHMLFYGPAGSGKKTRIMALLKSVFGPGVEKLRLEQRTITKPNSSTKIEVQTIASNYHIELNPSDAGNNDRLVVQEFIKEIAAHTALDSTSTKKGFKVVILSEVDRLSRDAQAALRRTMEKYTSSCRLILCCRNPSKVIPPVRSRCLGIRVAAPRDNEVVHVLQNIAKQENVRVSDELCARIALDARGNLRRAIFTLEACRVSGGTNLMNSMVIQRPQWELFIEKLADSICKEQSPMRLLEARSMVYELMVNCIPGTLILKTLANALSKKLDDELKHEVAKWAAFYEHRMQLGSKEIFHIEAFIAKFMSLYKQFLSMMDW